MNQPTANFWFADQLLPDEPGYSEDFSWHVFIQLPGMVDHLTAGFPSEQAAEEFIRKEIFGAGLKLS